MIVYRVQASISGNWTTLWVPTVAEAKARAKDFSDYPTRIDAVEVGTTRLDICTALNHADSNFTVFPGERLYSHG